MYGLWSLFLPHLAQRTAEQVIENTVAIFRVRHDDVLKAAVSLILLDCLFQQAPNKCRA
jgi:hypothetical protein